MADVDPESADEVIAMLISAAILVGDGDTVGFARSMNEIKISEIYIAVLPSMEKRPGEFGTLVELVLSGARDAAVAALDFDLDRTVGNLLVLP